MRGKHLGIVADRGAEQPQGVADQELHGGGRRRQHRHHETDQGRDRERHPVGVEDGVGLGENFDEQHHDNGHDHGRVNHALLAEQSEEQAGGERGRGDVGKSIAEQDGADEALAHGEQIVHHPGVGVAALFERVHLGARGRGERCL